MKARMLKIWQGWIQVLDLLILIRIPLVLMAVAAVMVGYVPQIHELFDISLTRPDWLIWTWLFTAALSLAAWYSARTLYSFRWPRRAMDQRIQRQLARILPRALACALPLTIALAYAGISPGEQAVSKWWPVLGFIALGLTLLLLTIYRRTLIRASSRLPVLKSFRLSTGVTAEPPVRMLSQWQELGHWRLLHYLAIAVLVSSWFAGILVPNWIAVFGPLALVLGAMAMLVAASTWPVYLAARARVPLLTGMVVLASLVTLTGLNDNHAVRLEAGQSSHARPPAELSYEATDQPELAAHLAEWRADPAREECDGQVFFISAEGGGIRAAMWPALVLDHLHEQSGGLLWRCTAAVSGVSGGSLGLTTHALMQLHGADGQSRLAAMDFLKSDFLAPVLGAMFGTDLVQRIVPWPIFVDRGQALEDAWTRQWQRRFGTEGPGFDWPLSMSARDPQTDQPRAALFLNTTLVDDGRRLIQHPFAAAEDRTLFPGAEDGAGWLPAELPLFSAVHNSARFTLVSPAGTLWRRDGPDVLRLGQVVDGGYFENSGATTLEALIRLYLTDIDPAARVRVIHLSNDPAVEPFAHNGFDRCDLPEAPAAQAPLFGELRAPARALLATRNARGFQARQSLLQLVDSLAPTAELWHYRLCKDIHPIPLGWTLGALSVEEMGHQLNSSNTDAQCMRCNSDQIRSMLTLSP